MMPSFDASRNATPAARHVRLARTRAWGGERQVAHAMHRTEPRLCRRLQHRGQDCHPTYRVRRRVDPQGHRYMRRRLPAVCGRMREARGHARALPDLRRCLPLLHEGVRRGGPFSDSLSRPAPRVWRINANQARVSPPTRGGIHPCRGSPAGHDPTGTIAGTTGWRGGFRWEKLQ
jgi:hypothetical protein